MSQEPTEYVNQLEKDQPQIVRRVIVPVFNPATCENDLQQSQELKKSIEENGPKLPAQEANILYSCEECEKERQSKLECLCGKFECEECIKEQKEKEHEKEQYSSKKILELTKEIIDKNGSLLDKSEQLLLEREKEINELKNQINEEILAQCIVCQCMISKDEIVYKNMQGDCFCSVEHRSQYSEENNGEN